VAEEGGTGWLGEWLAADVLYACAAGAAVGVAVGWGAAWSVRRLRDRELLAPAFDGYHAIATALMLYGAAEAAGGYGFLAVFSGGLAFRRYEHGHELNGRVHEGAEQVEKFMELAAILLLGSLLTSSGLTAPGWEGWLLAVVLLLVIRPLSTFISLLGSQVETAGGRSFVAWFGVHGVGTIYYAAVVVGTGVLSGAEEELVVWTAIACVIVSIVVHGVTGGPALRLLFRNLREDERRKADPPLRPRPAPEPETSPSR
jgi:NhaP-type Na+/H+ or K+/H+ antiporter